jgi:hypothetical protein
LATPEVGSKECDNETRVCLILFAILRPFGDDSDKTTCKEFMTVSLSGREILNQSPASANQETGVDIGDATPPSDM